MKIALYTAICGNKDKLIKAPKIEGVETILFTDCDVKNNMGWKIIKIEDGLLTPRLNAKKPKILPHKYLSEFNTTLWVDGNMSFLNVHKFINKFKNEDMVVFNHGRNCIYDEAKVVIKKKKDDVNVVNRHMVKYRDKSYPSNNGLICGGVILRQNKPEINKIMDEWWVEIINGSSRDQLSFNYVAWLNNFEPTYLDLKIENNEYFKIKKHLK